MSLQPVSGGMRFAITPDFDAVCIITAEAVAGEVYHVERNTSGGANSTQVALIFAWRPQHVENFHPHWRVDCFVRIHPLSPDPAMLGKAVAEALLRESVCSEPLWVSWHRSEEIRGKAFGEVFDFE
jgi:hypothetical protein